MSDNYYDRAISNRQILWEHLEGLRPLLEERQDVYLRIWLNGDQIHWTLDTPEGVQAEAEGLKSVYCVA